MNYLGNSFSLQMIENGDHAISVKEIKAEDVPIDAKSVIGHTDTAAVVSGILGRNVCVNRESITLRPVVDTLYVAQLMGGRLPEGATTLPDGFKISFMKISVEE